MPNYQTFKRDMDSKYPDTWEMKGDSLYKDLLTQFDDKMKFVAEEQKSLDSKLLTVEQLESQTFEWEKGPSTILAAVLLLGLPIATLTGFLTGFVSIVE